MKRNTPLLLLGIALVALTAQGCRSIQAAIPWTEANADFKRGALLPQTKSVGDQTATILTCVDQHMAHHNASIIPEEVFLHASRACAAAIWPKVQSHGSLGLAQPEGAQQQSWELFERDGAIWYRSTNGEEKPLVPPASMKESEVRRALETAATNCAWGWESEPADQVAGFSRCDCPQGTWCDGYCFGNDIIGYSCTGQCVGSRPGGPPPPWTAQTWEQFSVVVAP